MGFVKETIEVVVKFGFEQLELSRIQALIDENNINSAKAAKRAFSEYVPEGKMDEILNSDSKSQALNRFQGNIAVFRIHQTLSDAGSVMQEIFRIFLKSNFVIDNIFFPVIYAWQHDINPQFDFENLIKELSGTEDKLFSIIYGTVSGIKGNIGVNNRMTYSFVPDEMEKILPALPNMEKNSVK